MAQTNQTVTILAGQLTATQNVVVNGDSAVEANETVNGAISGLAAGGRSVTLGTATAAGTILNDDATVTLAVAPASTLEDSGPNLVYTFTRTGYTGGPLTVFFNVGGSATLTSDYTQSGAATFASTAGSVTFTGTSATATVSIAPVVDTFSEGDETVQLTLASGTGYASGTAAAVTGTITDDDAVVSVAIGATPVEESSTTGLVYTFTRTADTSTPLTINFTKSGTAAFTSDYSATSSGTLNFAAGTLTIPAGQSSATVTLLPVDDRLVEGSETAILTVATGANYAISGSPATGTITDNDTATIGFSIPSSTAGEGAGSDPVSLVLIVLSSGTTGTAGLGRDVTLNVTAAAGGTAIGGGTDYTLPTLVTFSAGALSGATQNANLAITNDSLVEGPETVNLALGNLTDSTGGQVTFATGAAASHTTTITDDDTATIGFSTPTSTLGEATASDPLGLVLTITPGAGSTGTASLASDVTFNITTATGGTATGGGGDYTLPALVTFNSGALSGATKTANLAIVNDARVEGNETANLGLALGTDGTSGQVTIATGAGASHVTTITDNDTATLGYATAAPTVGEGEGSAPVTLELTFATNGTGPVGLDRTVSFDVITVAGGTATSGGTDYTLPASVTFGPSTATSQTVDVPITNDRLVEGSETVSLGLAINNDPTGGQVTIATGTAATQTKTILDNDSATIGFQSPTSTVGEGDGTDALIYVLNITAAGTGPTSLDRTVTFNTNAASGGTASGSGVDYTLPATATFNVGSLNGATTTAELGLINDSSVEGNETVILSPSIVADGTGGQITIIASASHTTTITDDDTATIGFAKATSVTSEGGGNDPLGLVLTIKPGAGSTGTPMLERSVSVNVTTTGGTATGGGEDYTLPPLTTFAAGSLQGATLTANLAITDDSETEVLETANLGLAVDTDNSGGQITIATGQAGRHITTITDDDSAVSVTTSTAEVAEDATVGKVFTFTRNGDTSQALTFTFSAGGTASAADDYTLTGADLFNPQTGLGALTFAAGRDTATVTLKPKNDTLVEGDETASLAVNPGAGYGVGESPALGTINDNDTATVSFVTLTSNTPESTSPLTVAVQLTTIGNGVAGAGSLQNAFTFSVIDLGVGTATGGGVDYTIPAQSFTFAAGDTGSTQNASVSIVNDTLSEGDETFSLGLDNASNSAVTLAAASHVANIQDNDVDVSITTEVPATDPVAGSGVGNLHYTITVQNTGLTEAVNLVLDEAFTLPAGVTFASATASDGTFVVANGDGGGRLALPALAKNATATLDLYFTAASSTADGALAYVVTAASSADQTLVNPSDDSDLAGAMIIRQADLAVTVADSPNPIAPNRDLTYTIHVVNNGPSDAASVSVTDHLPANTTFVSATGPAGWAAVHTTGQDEGAVFTTDALASGAAADLTFVVHVAASAQGQTINDTATVSSSNTDPVVSNNSDTEGTLVGQGFYAVAASQPEGVARGIEPRVRIFNYAGEEGESFLAYEASYVKGIHLAIGDLTGDGVDDIVTATHTGSGRIRVFDGLTHQPVALGGSMELAAFDGRIALGAQIALADVDGDHHLDIIAGSATRGGKVNVFSGVDGHLLKTSTPFGPTYRGTVSVAAADLDGDGKAEIVSGANASRVQIDFGGAQADFAFYAFAGRAREGAVVTLGDTTGDGIAEIIVGHNTTTAHSGPALEIFQVTNAATRPTVAKLKTIALARPTYNFGVRVAATDLNSDGLAEILVAAGYAGQSTVEIIDAATGLVNSQFTAFAAPKLGVSVAASPHDGV